MYKKSGALAARAYGAVLRNGFIIIWSLSRAQFNYFDLCIFFNKIFLLKSSFLNDWLLFR